MGVGKTEHEQVANIRKIYKVNNGSQIYHPAVLSCCTHLRRTCEIYRLWICCWQGVCGRHTPLSQTTMPTPQRTVLCCECNIQQCCGKQDQQSGGPWGDRWCSHPVPYPHRRRLQVWNRVPHTEGEELSLREPAASEERVSFYKAGRGVGTER